MLSIFNNGSSLWILVILLALWVAHWGNKLYKSHQSGYEKTNTVTGITTDQPKTLKNFLSNSNFIMLVIGVAGILLMLFLINADYR